MRRFADRHRNLACEPDQRTWRAIRDIAGTLRQVLANLVGNALKFSHPERSPLVRVRSEMKGGKVRIWVEDNGIGIAPEHCDRIFRLFERLHTSQAYPGTGIGLALVRKGAERMGGTAGVESELEKGSRFWIELPMG